MEMDFNDGINRNGRAILHGRSEAPRPNRPNRLLIETVADPVDDSYVLSMAVFAHNERKPDGAFKRRLTGRGCILPVILMEHNRRADTVVADAINCPGRGCTGRGSAHPA